MNVFETNKKTKKQTKKSPFTGKGVIFQDYDFCYEACLL